jgi:putative transposase
MTFSFGRFRDRAKAKAELLGKRVELVNEAYTSKTANWTGEIVQNLGGKKTIKSDNVTFDRDINGALGIFLKCLCGIPPERKLCYVNES